MWIIDLCIKLYELIVGYKARLTINNVTIYPHGKDLLQGRGSHSIDIDLIIRNKSSKSSTVEGIYLNLNGKSLKNILQKKNLLIESLNVLNNYSKSVELHTNTSISDLKKILNKNVNKLEIIVAHTYGEVKWKEDIELKL
ncbi:MAG: hypothetical protein WCV90_05685 [Candidatus Woesearchaeota archaeon]|jgi:hypothetical protein